MGDGEVRLRLQNAVQRDSTFTGVVCCNVIMNRRSHPKTVFETKFSGDECQNCEPKNTVGSIDG